MNNKDLLDLWEGLTMNPSVYNNFTLDVEGATSIWDQLMGISSSATTNPANEIPLPDKYWTKRQYDFLKRCCDSNLRQFAITVPAGMGGIFYFEEVIFETVFPTGFHIIGKLAGSDNYTYNLPSSGFEEAEWEIPMLVKTLMKQVFENYKITQNLEK